MSHRVLIVEDERIVQLHLRRIVESLGHAVVGTAVDREEALAAAERETPDLVLMDIRLAGGDDGVETARALAARFDCAVVFISAYADPDTVARTDTVGAAGYLVKPFSVAQVRAALSTAVAGSRRLQRAEERSRSLETLAQDLSGDLDGGLLTVDREGRVTFANRTVRSWLDWSGHGMEGLSLPEALGASGPPAAALEAAFDRALKGQSAQLEFQLRGRRGSQREVRAECSPTDGSHSPVGVLVRLTEREAIATPKRPPREQVRPFAPGTRLLVYSHDTFGLGHLRRCMTLIRTLVREHEGLSVLLVTGSPMVHRYTLPPGTDYVKLPSLRKVEAERYEARSLGIPGQDVQSLRASLILDTVREYDPNVLLVDHSPTGSRGELLPTLEWLGERGGCTRILGLRDIIDEPASVRELWESSGVHDVLERHYEHVVVYGSREIFDLRELYGLRPAVAARTHFIHYVCNHADEESNAPEPTASDRPTVVVTIGGGDGGGETVIAPFLEMLRQHRDEVDFHTEILTGPFLEPALEARFRQQAADLPVTVHSFVPSTRKLVERADLVVATAGYNTVTDLLGHARRALLIPRVLYRREQEIRAERLAGLGWVDTLHPDGVTPEALWEAIGRARSDEPLARARAAGLPLDGAARFSAFCRELAAQAPERLRRSGT
jgi:predicted glycosyltransferase/DNA-binding NarL/FixJ family response regulator